MFLHNINYDKFNIQLGNTLIDPHFGHFYRADRPQKTIQLLSRQVTVL